MMNGCMDISVNYWINKKEQEERKPYLCCVMEHRLEHWTGKGYGYNNMKKILEHQVPFPVGAESDNFTAALDTRKKHHIGVRRTADFAFIAAPVAIIRWKTIRDPSTTVF